VSGVEDDDDDLDPRETAAIEEVWKDARHSAKTTGTPIIIKDLVARVRQVFPGAHRSRVELEMMIRAKRTRGIKWSYSPDTSL
jgi:hypothetical protein